MTDHRCKICGALYPHRHLRVEIAASGELRTSHAVCERCYEALTPVVLAEAAAGAWTVAKGFVMDDRSVAAKPADAAEDCDSERRNDDK